MKTSKAYSRCYLVSVALMLAASHTLAAGSKAPPAAAAPSASKPAAQIAAPKPRPARQTDPAAISNTGRQARLEAISNVKMWAMQLQRFDPSIAGQTAADMLVTDATTGSVSGQPFTRAEIDSLKVKPDGGRRLMISYLSIGEAEDYRPDYFTSEYMTEDAPDWLLGENQVWKGNRIIRFCTEGWQQTILGDENGMSVYNSVEPSPLYKLIEAGFDGVYLDRVDVYAEVQKDCPNAAEKMVEFVERLAAHARKKNPNFIVIQQNAEDLLRHKRIVAAIDAVAKEDLFFGVDHTQRANSAGVVKDALENLAFAKSAGRPVFVLDYVNDPETQRIDRDKIRAQGFVPYIGPRPLDELWLPKAGG